MKNFILRTAFSKAGPVITAGVAVIVGFILGWIVTGLSAIGLPIDAAQQTEVSLSITAGIYWFLNQLINKYAGEHAVILQKILRDANPLLKVDRWIGPETIAAAQAAAQASAVSNPSTGKAEPEVYQGIPVPQAPTPKPQPTKRKKRINPLKR